MQDEQPVARVENLANIIERTFDLVTVIISVAFVKAL